MRKGVLAIFISFVLVVAFSNCAPPEESSPSNGTDTGNVRENDPGVMTIASGICMRVVDCDGAQVFATCDNQIKDQPGMPRAIGIPDSAGYSTLRAVLAAELRGDVPSSVEIRGDCLMAIENLSCGDVSPLSIELTSLGTVLQAEPLVSAIPACTQMYGP